MRHPWRAARRHPIPTAGAAVIVAGAAGFLLYYFSPQSLFISNTVNDAAPTSSSVTQQPAAGTAPTPSQSAPVVVARSSFRSLEHQTSGSALILRLSDGSVVLRLEDLNTSNGPDVHVTLSPVPSTGGLFDFNRDYLDLGSLKGNRGNQNYSVPAGTNLARFNSVVIWCKRFSVGFAVAPISSR